jgi:prephenate dehydratase
LNTHTTSIDSLGTKKLLEIKDQTCNDTWQLFHDLQTFNPYTKNMRLQLGKAYDKLFNELVPKAKKNGVLTVGIQGGKGSFNEAALTEYAKKNNITNLKTVYLYQTEKVLHALHVGNIDKGLFAISNSTGGLVEESIQAMGKYKFSIVEDFTIPIHYVLMKRKDTKDIHMIMGHPQVFKQCEQTLKKRFPKLPQKSGERDLVDTAKAAQALSKGEVSKNTAILGPETLAKIYNLEIIDRALEDKKDNITRFLLVKR